MKKRIIQNLSRLSKGTLQSKMQIQSKYNDFVKEAQKRLADKDNFLNRQNLKIPSINQSLKGLSQLKNNLDFKKTGQSLQKLKNRFNKSTSQAAEKLTKSFNQNIKPKVNETKDSIKKTQQKVVKQSQEKIDDVKEALGQKFTELKSKQKEASKALDERFSSVKNRLFNSTKQWAKISKDKGKSLFKKSEEKVVEQSKSKIKDIKKTLKDKFSLTKKKEKQPQNLFDSNLSFLKNSLSNSTNYLTKKSSQLPKQLGQSSLKAVKSLKESVDVNKKIKGTIDYLFWRIAILIGIVCFSYGIGSALPKEIRKLLKQTMMMKNDENSQNGDKKSSPQG